LTLFDFHLFYKKAKSSSFIRKGGIFMEIRGALPQDMMFLFELRNDPAVRGVSFNTDEIDLNTHSGWFAKKLRDANCLILIIEDGGKKIGQVRFDKDNNVQSAEVNIALTKEFRSRGYGSAALKMVCKHALEHFGVIKIIAHIKKDNAASLKSFAKAGFRIAGDVDFNGQMCAEMILEK